MSMGTVGSRMTLPSESLTAKSSRRFLLESSIVPICSSEVRDSHRPSNGEKRMEGGTPIGTISVVDCVAYWITCRCTLY